MSLDLVANWLVLGISKDIKQQWNLTVAYSNASDKTLINKFLKLLVNHVGRVSYNLEILPLPLQSRNHMMNQVKIYVVKTKRFKLSS